MHLNKEAIDVDSAADTIPLLNWRLISAHMNKDTRICDMLDLKCASSRNQVTDCSHGLVNFVWDMVTKY